MSTLPPKASDPTEIAGRYEVIQKLGAGAFGTVYKAKDRILGRMLAIKTIRVESLAAAGASYEEMLTRFKREAQISAKLKHPNIVTIYDIGDSEGMSYLAMEFIDGTGLEKIISQGGRLSLERAAAIGAQVADALDFAHKNSVVHRDIKPANIMIEAGDRVKVTDFGIARATDSADHLTMTGSLLGTPSYMSPEQARGANLDGRSDIFSLGCVLYEMVAGHKAFRGESITALIFKIITEEPPSLRDVDPSVPDAMLHIIARTLAKTPETRYQSGKELAEDLLSLTRAGSMPTIRATDVGTTPGMAAQVASSSPTVLTPATVLTPTPPPLPESPTRAGPPRSSPAPPRQATIPPPPAATQHKKGSGGGLAIVAALGVVGVLGLGVVGGAAWWFFGRSQPTDSGTLSTSTVPESTVQPTAEPSVLEPAPSDTALPEPTPAATLAPQATATAPSTTASRSTPPPTSPATHDSPPATTAPTSQRQGGGNFAYLNDEPEEGIDGRAAGEAAARGYGGGKNNAGYGTSRQLHARARSPRNLKTPAERAAVATMRHLINAQLVFAQRHNSRYGSLRELGDAKLVFLDVPFGSGDFQRQGYRFTLSTESDGFRVVASPLQGGMTSFEGDDTGIIRAIE